MQAEFIFMVIILTILFIIIPLFIFNLREQRQHIWQAILVLIIVLTCVAIIATHKILMK